MRVNGEEEKKRTDETAFVLSRADSFLSDTPFLDVPDTTQKRVFRARRGWRGRILMEYCSYKEQEKGPAKAERLKWKSVVYEGAKYCSCRYCPWVEFGDVQLPVMLQAISNTPCDYGRFFFLKRQRSRSFCTGGLGAWGRWDKVRDAGRRWAVDP